MMPQAPFLTCPGAELQFSKLKFQAFILNPFFSGLFQMATPFSLMQDTGQ